MTAQVVCEQCCKQVPEDQCVAAEDGRMLCLMCLPEAEDEDRVLHRTPAEECCCEGPPTDAAPLTPEREAPLLPPEPSDWANGI